MSSSKFNTLILIGNGFDRWQNLPTSYEDFRKYYYANIDRVMKELKITPMKVDDPKNPGKKKSITPVEFIYGNAFKPDNLLDEFFWNFENSTALIDDQMLNLYFGTTDKGLYDLQETVEQAQTILQKIFGEWAASVPITVSDNGYAFPDNCYIINFNYTDTLEKRFGVDPSNDYHIHGDASDPESIIFGHATHPEMPYNELMEQKMIRSVKGGPSKRLRGLYLTESALYDTDKHVQDNIDDLCEFMTLDGVHIEEITDIYVLGQSFGDPDIEYFKFLSDATKGGTDLNRLSALSKAESVATSLMNEDNLMKFIELNIGYATHHRIKWLHKDNVESTSGDREEAMLKATGLRSYDELYSFDDMKEEVHKRFILEQADGDREVMDELVSLYGIEEYPAEYLSVLSLANWLDSNVERKNNRGETLNYPHGERKANAHWHISYHSDKDKDRIEKVMQKIGCGKNDYDLYESIDECIEDFRTQ